MKKKRKIFAISKWNFNMKDLFIKINTINRLNSTLDIFGNKTRQWLYRDTVHKGK